MSAKSYIYFIAVLLSTVIFALAGCGETSTSQSGQGAVSAKLVWNSGKTTGKIVASAPAGVSTVRLAISGTGITTIQQDFPAADGKGTLSSVPVGSGLTVTASGLDSSGTVIYQGSVGSVTILGGQTTDVGTITMTAVTPAQAGFTTEMISGKTFAEGPSNTVTFNTDGTLTASDSPDALTWAVNASGQVVVSNSTMNNSTTITFVSGDLITGMSVTLRDSDGTIESTTLTLKAPSASIIGTWGVYGADATIITFVDSTHYMLVSAGVADTGGQAGLEYGTYSYDPATGVGAFAASPIADTNGDWGASDPPSGTSYTIQVTGDTLTVGNTVEGNRQVPRLKNSATNPVIGGWWNPGATVLLAFLDSTHFLLAQVGVQDAGGQSGIEFGTYAISGTNVLSTTRTVDTNGDWGTSNPPVGTTYAVTVSGNTLTVINSVEGSFSLTRLE